MRPVARPILALLLALIGWAPASRGGPVDGHEENALYQALLTDGLAGTGRLPAPRMADGLDAARQKAAIASIPGLRLPVAELLRKSTVAPVVLTVGRPGPDSQAPRVRTLDLWFIVHGDLERIGHEEGAVDLFPRDLDSYDRLREPQLSRRGLDAPGPNSDVTHGTFTVLERVKLRLTMTTTWSRTDDSVVVAGTVDGRFRDDAEFPNEWRPIQTAGGKDVLGPSSPYTVFGFYQKATRLREPAGAWLVEFHATFEHPAGWFGGRDLLTSKLPLATETGVRTFRKRVEKLGAPAAGGTAREGPTANAPTPGARKPGRPRAIRRRPAHRTSGPRGPRGTRRSPRA
jgi:hypothetical protein